MMDTIAIQAIQALAAIDAELGMPEDGCNSTQATIAAIRALKAKSEIARHLAETDFDAVAWAYAKLGAFNVLSSTAENAHMADRLYSMLRLRPSPAGPFGPHD